MYIFIQTFAIYYLLFSVNIDIVIIDIWVNYKNLTHTETSPPAKKTHEPHVFSVDTQPRGSETKTLGKTAAWGHLQWWYIFMYGGLECFGTVGWIGLNVKDVQGKHIACRLLDAVEIGGGIRSRSRSRSRSSSSSSSCCCCSCSCCCCCCCCCFRCRCRCCCCCCCCPFVVRLLLLLLLSVCCCCCCCWWWWWWWWCWCWCCCCWWWWWWCDFLSFCRSLWCEIPSGKSQFRWGSPIEKVLNM